MISGQEYNKRIGIVLSSLPGYSETFFRNKIKGLQKQGFRVSLFIDEDLIDDPNFPCEVIFAPSFKKNLLSRYRQSFIAILKCIFVNPRRSLRLYRLDAKDGMSKAARIKNVLYNQYLLAQELDWIHFGYGMLATSRENVAQAMNVKMAVSFRGFDLYLSPLKHKGCYQHLFSKQVRYHVLSEKMKLELQSFGANKDDIHVITPAIDISLFESSKQNSPSNKRLEILCVSRLHWIKGIQYVLEALAILNDKGLDFCFTVIGEGKERERLVFAAHQLGIRDKVNFTGKLPHNEVIQTLKRSDIYIQYSIQEGFGNAVLEAQAMGLPCIVSDAGGLQQNVLDKTTGWVVPKRNPKLLAQTIKEIAAIDQAEKQKITQNAIERVRRDFNLEQQNRLFCEFYMQ